MEFIFTPWKNFFAFRDRAVDRDAMRFAAKEAEKTLKDGIRSPPKTGRIYRRKKGIHQASRPFVEYPANETGALLASVRSDSSSTHATVGTNTRYAKFLRGGTRFMGRRKMSDTAMHHVAAQACRKLRNWVVWREQ
jgi:phage gpG-like protein